MSIDTGLGTPIPFHEIFDDYETYWEEMVNDEPEFERRLEEVSNSPILKRTFLFHDGEEKYRDKLRLGITSGAFCLDKETLLKVLAEHPESLITTMVETLNNAIYADALDKDASFSLAANLSTMISMERFPTCPNEHLEDIFDYLQLPDRLREILAKVISVRKPTLH